LGEVSSGCILHFCQDSFQKYSEDVRYYIEYIVLHNIETYRGRTNKRVKPLTDVKYRLHPVTPK